MPPKTRRSKSVGNSNQGPSSPEQATNTSTTSNLIETSPLQNSTITLEERLELLECRFTDPSIGNMSSNSNNNNMTVTLGGTLPLETAGLGSPSSPTASVHSEHSYSFSPPAMAEALPGGTNHTASNLPASAVRSRKRPSVSTPLHAVSMAAARHMRKVAANSPVQGMTSNQSSPGHSTMSGSQHSNQTMVTSHVQHQRQQVPSQQNQYRVVAESPPVIVTPAPPAPGSSSRVHSKPPAVRNILSHTSSATAAAHSNSSTTKRKSPPKRKQPSVKDKSAASTATAASSGSVESEVKRARTTAHNEPTGRPLQPPLSNFSEQSNDRSNGSHSNSGRTKSSKAPANNRRIQEFFPSATQANSNNTSGNSIQKRRELAKSVTTIADSATSKTSSSLNVDSSSSTKSAVAASTNWQARCKKLEQALKDKEEQLKAVTNNKTILHTALQSALDQTRQEYAAVQKSHQEKNAKTQTVLEEMIRWKSSQQAKELRERLATEGNRLGRIVYSRAGMRALESWEEGHATKDLEQRKQALKQKRKVLEQRQRALDEQTIDGCNPLANMEIVEARASIQMHLENIRNSERELREEEHALNDEKGVHIRALKRVASEDASRFRSRPKLHDRYVLQYLLGKGGFSEVWKAYDLVELREVAVKIHQLDPRWSDSKKENYTKHVSREYEIHRNVRHPRIVSLYDVFEIDTNSFATVLECCDGTDLDTLLKSKKRLPEKQAKATLLQILSGMRYLSEPSGTRQGIIHYDLKPGNILFDEFGDAKITDFGLSKIVDATDPAESMELTSQGAGTYWYLPPECFITTEKVRISNKVDVWSIGVIFYQMLYGVRPFGEGKSQDKLLTDHTMLNAQQVHMPENPSVSESGKAFIRQCLMYDQAFRPTIAQLCENPYLFENTP